MMDRNMSHKRQFLIRSIIKIISIEEIAMTIIYGASIYQLLFI